MNQSQLPAAGAQAPLEPGLAARDGEGVPTLDVLHMTHTLWGSRYYIALLTVIIATVAFNLILLIPPKYAAVTRVLIDPRGLQVVEKDLTPRSQTSDGQFAVVESQKRVMTSDEVLRPVIASENLETDPEFGGKKETMSFDIRGMIYGLIGLEPQAPDLKALRNMWRAVWAERDKGSHVIDLWVTTKDPAKSARIANAIATTYVQSEFAQRSSMARKASGALMGKLGELRERLREAEDRVEKYKAEHSIIDAEGKLVNEQQLAQLNKELSVARAETSKTRSQYEQIRLLQKTDATPGAIAEAVKSETIKELRVRYAAARQSEMSLFSQLMPAHPALQRARARVASVRGEISNELSRIAEAARIEYERAKGNEEELARKVETLKSTALLTNEAQVKMRELSRDAEANRLVYNAFLLRARELGEQEGVNSAVARIISPAIPPRKPAGPSLPIIIVALAIVSFALSIFYVLARDAIAPYSRRKDG